MRLYILLLSFVALLACNKEIPEVATIEKPCEAYLNDIPSKFISYADTVTVRKYFDVDDLRCFFAVEENGKRHFMYDIDFDASNLPSGLPSGMEIMNCKFVVKTKKLSPNFKLYPLFDEEELGESDDGMGHLRYKFYDENDKRLDNEVFSLFTAIDTVLRNDGVDGLQITGGLEPFIPYNNKQPLCLPQYIANLPTLNYMTIYFTSMYFVPMNANGNTDCDYTRQLLRSEIDSMYVELSYIPVETD